MPPTPTELRQRPTIPEHIPLNDQPLDPERKHVGVDGKWYDVTDFIERHPGGPVIEMFIGKDATHVFHAYGHRNVLKYRKPVGTYTMPARHPADEDFDKLLMMFKEKGYFETDLWFYVCKISVCFSLLALTFASVIFSDRSWVHYLGAVSLAFFWQQIGFVMHEFMHTQVFRRRLKDRAGGVCLGTVFFGMSASWWQDEHIYHHAMTNTVDVAQKFVDPQMWESVWAQNEKLFPLFRGALAHFFIRIQHFTFVPMVVMFGRIEILLDSYRLERRWYEWLAIIAHWIWMVTLLSLLPTWREVIIFYTIAAFVEGIFHFQLILSHYAKAFLSVSEFHKSSWYVMQVLSNLNIDTPWWQDWYYGGLNYHIEHHLFPTMARKYLRDAAPYVQAVCKKHGIDYDMCSFTQAMFKTLEHLKVTGDHYTLEFR